MTDYDYHKEHKEKNHADEHKSIKYTKMSLMLSPDS